MSVISFSLFRFQSLATKCWAFSQMGLAKHHIRSTPDIGFFKLMGTGAGAGFSTRPDFSVYTLLAEWPSIEVGRKAFSNSTILNKYRSKADRTATIFLEPVSARGTWDGHQIDAPINNAPKQQTPIVAITRASIRPAVLFRFWSLVPAISERAEFDTHRQFMIGTGEIPWLHQVTFSVWDSVDAMSSFSKNSRTHGVAVQRAYEENWFSECCFMRFNVRAFEGSWPGLDDLSDVSDTHQNRSQIVGKNTMPQVHGTVSS